MKGMIVFGSRNPDGFTATAARAMREGFMGTDGVVKEVFLPAKRIERCRQCGLDGWGTCLKQGKCIIQDDFAELAEDMRTCDFVVFATPVYFGDISESVNAFLGRLRRIGFRKEKIMEAKPAVGICIAGGGGDGTLSCASNMQKILLDCGFNVMEMIPVRRQNLDAKKMTTLKHIGGWFVSVVPEGA